MNEKISDEYIQGFLDCVDGLPARDDMSEDYIRGYGDQYQMEQIRSYRCEVGHER